MYIRQIEAYKTIAEEGLKNLQSPQDLQSIRLLTNEIQNLKHEEERLQSAKKVDNLFLRALKFVFWVVTTPIRVFVRIFVREKSPEERIQNIANKIFRHISISPENKALAALQIYQGERVESDLGSKDVREMLIGHQVDTTLVRYLFLNGVEVKVPAQFFKDIIRTPYLKVQDRDMFEGIPSQDPIQQTEVYRMLQSTVGEEGLSVFLNILNQGFISATTTSFNQNLVPQLQKITKNVEDIDWMALSTDKATTKELGRELVAKASFSITVFEDDKNNVHFIYTDPSVLTNINSEESIGLMAYERELIISKADLANVQKLYQPKIDKLERQLASYLEKQEGNMSPEIKEKGKQFQLDQLAIKQYEELKKKLILDDESLIDPSLTPSLQVFDGYSAVYSLKDGIMNAREKAFADLAKKRKEQESA